MVKESEKKDLQARLPASWPGVQGGRHPWRRATGGVPRVGSRLFDGSGSACKSLRGGMRVACVSSRNSATKVGKGWDGVCRTAHDRAQLLMPVHDCRCTRVLFMCMCITYYDREGVTSSRAK